MHIKLRLTHLLLAALCYVAAALPSSAADALKNAPSVILPADTYMLAIGACPPWKPATIAQMCKNDVNKMTVSFKQKYGIPEKNIQIVLDEQATYDGVKKGLAWLKEKSAPNTRAILYLNVHGSLEEVDSQTSTLKEHEMLVLWTKDKPSTVDFALAEQQWMLATELREILDSFDNEKIVIIDACHSGAAEADLDAHHPLTPGIDEREAIITSAHASQVAYITKDGSMALFTSFLNNAILHGAPNLDKAFAISADKTIKTSQQMCKKGAPANYKDTCHTQIPSKHDPYGLLSAVSFR